MVFSSYLLLIPFALFLLAFALFGLINIINLLKYGGATFTVVFAVFCFLTAAAFVIFLTFNQLSAYDWQSPITIFENFNNSDFLNGNSF